MRQTCIRVAVEPLTCCAFEQIILILDIYLIEGVLVLTSF